VQALLGVTLLFLPLLSWGAGRPPELGTASPARAEMVLRVDVDLVSLPVSVTDARFRAVSGLRPDHFEVYEDKVRQEINSVSEVDAPLSVGLVFDASGSVSSNIELCKLAVRAFFEHANREDEYFLIEFNDSPHLLVPFTSRTNRLLAHVGAARGGGHTALYDAIYFALAEMKKARNSRKVLVVLTDGAENASRYSEKDIRNALRESDVLLYTIGVFEPVPYRNTREQLAGPTNLARLAKMTGGHGFVLGNPYLLPDLTANISRELHTQYELTYYPINRTRDGQWRRVRVKVKARTEAPPLEARSPSGYYAPSF
jgi:Ca-activated chloride channel family protein